jgi:hypothetical protein
LTMRSALPACSDSEVGLPCRVVSGMSLSAIS